MDLENIVVGKVVKADKHPNADKLKLCEVDIGTEKIKIVCGGSNVRENMLVALAKVGSKVRWHGEGDLIELEEQEKFSYLKNFSSFFIPDSHIIILLLHLPFSDDHDPHLELGSSSN